MAQRSVFETIEYLMKVKGMTREQAIAEVESVLRAKLPDNIKDMIRR